MAVELIAGGHKLDYVLTVIGRSDNTYKDWREKDVGFRAAVDNVRATHRRGEVRSILGSLFTLISFSGWICLRVANLVRFILHSFTREVMRILS